MRKMFFAAAILGALALAGCGEDHPDNAQKDNTAANHLAALPGTGGSTAQKPIADVEIPEGAKYTIVCHTFTTPGHALDAKHFKEQLLKVPTIRDMKAWFIIQGEQSTTLYYGYYGDAAVFDQESAEARRARDDQQRLGTLVNNKTDEKLFPFTPLVSLDMNASGPPEWDLANAKGYWSVMIAGFTGADHAKNAVTVVRELRHPTDGSEPVEAYYHVGAGSSTVCVGLWPREAVKEQDKSDAKTDNANTPLMVIDPTIHMPANRRPMIPGDDTAEPLILQSRVEILDPTLKAMMAKFPHYAKNGSDGMTMKDGRKITTPSCLAIVPYAATIERDRSARDAKPDRDTPWYLQGQGARDGTGYRR